MASKVDICNRALQKLGAKRIRDLTDDSVNSRACEAAYDFVRDSVLRAHPWNFAIKRVALAADADAPEFGRANCFTLPADCLRVLPPYPEDNANDLDWQIEGRKIYTDDSAPLYVRYISRVTDTTLMDAVFVEALATKLAEEMCEEITQSNTKKATLADDFVRLVREARRMNAIENVAAEPPMDTWITVRR